MSFKLCLSFDRARRARATARATDGDTRETDESYSYDRREREPAERAGASTHPPAEQRERSSEISTFSCEHDSLNVQGCAKVQAAHQAAHKPGGLDHSNPKRRRACAWISSSWSRTATSAVELRDESRVVHDRRRRRLRETLRAHSRHQSIQRAPGRETAEDQTEAQHSRSALAAV